MPVAGLSFGVENRRIFPEENCHEGNCDKSQVQSTSELLVPVKFINPPFQSLVNQCVPLEHLRGFFRKRNVKSKAAPTSKLGIFLRFLNSNEFNPFGEMTGSIPTLFRKRRNSSWRKFASKTRSIFSLKKQSCNRR